MPAMTTSSCSGATPDVVVWEADGSVDDALGYGAPLATRLRAEGFRVEVVPLPRRAPTAAELAAPSHVISGGNTPVGADVDWLARTRSSLRPLLDAAMRGDVALTGICFGAQLLATELAGPAAVGVHPGGLQAGLVEVSDIDPATDGGPDRVAGTVSSFHFHRIDRERLEQAGCRVLLESERTPVQAFDAGVAIRGIQFHPELEPRQLRQMLRTRRDVLDRHLVSMGAVNRSLVASGRRWDTALWESLVVDPIRARTATEAAA